MFRQSLQLRSHVRSRARAWCTVWAASLATESPAPVASSAASTPSARSRASHSMRPGARDSRSGSMDSWGSARRARITPAWRRQ
ncbi:MAG: hypothetical protein E6I76_11145 [Chloroflexi bacterium]|nr:MAG: hypothetical protein E6I76_11145 [Chloroflexota bacterium]